MDSSYLQDSDYETALAIVGMAGRFPGALNVEQLWQNIAGGVKAMRHYSDEELLAAGVDPSLLQSSSYVKVGSPLEGIEEFDAAFFGYTPREAEIMDPQHRILLECAWETLEHAGYDPQRYAGLIGVFAGSAFSSYLFRNLFPQENLLERLGQLQVDAANDRDSLASKISYKLNLRGPGVSIQTFCSTSLVSVHLASQSLINYECDLALAGGVSFILPHGQGYHYEEGGIVSPDGECRTFDARAQGSVMGSGVGMVALKRLQDALDDRDQIYAVIRGSAMNNDGSTRVSYTAPGLDGQANVLQAALSYARVPVESISYIETHGTATRLGDAVELAAMRKVYERQTSRKNFCAIGSIKPNVGHLDRVAGVAGLIKTVQALRHRQLPPSLNFEHPHPESGLEESAFYVNTELRPWEPLKAGELRRAGVSSFGLGGTNAHVILEEGPALVAQSDEHDWQVLIWSARSETALAAMTRRLQEHLAQNTEQRLADVAYTLQVGRSEFPYRRTLVCQTREEALSALEEGREKNLWQGKAERKECKVAYLLPGVGEQYVGQTQDLYEHEPVFHDAVAQCMTLFKTYLDEDLLAILYAKDRPSSHGKTQQAGLNLRALMRRDASAPSALERLKQTAVAQPIVFMLEYALAQLLIHWNLAPQAMIGYSLGEYVAACLSGVLSLEDAIKLVARRAQLIQDLPGGAMLAVALSEQSMQMYLDEQISLAAINGPATCVVSGDEEDIEALEAQLNELGIVARRVETTHAFHSRQMEPILDRLRAVLSEISFHAPQIPYLSNVTGTWITSEQATDPEYWLRHLCQTVQFSAGMETLLQETDYALLEVGPGQSLSAFAKQHPACKSERLAMIVPTLTTVYDQQQSEQASLLQAIGKLWLVGVRFNWSVLHEERLRYRVPLPAYPFERQRYWIDPPKSGSGQKRQVQTRQGKLTDPADWFYLPTWEQEPLLTARSSVAPMIWLLFMDELQLAEQLAQVLERDGDTCIRVYAGTMFAQQQQGYTIRPGDPADYLSLCRALAEKESLPQKVIHGWSFSSSNKSICTAERFAAQQESGFYSVLFLAKALATIFHADPLEILVVSNYLQTVTGLEAVQPEKSPVQAACRVIPQEQLNITCRCIDLDGELVTARVVAQVAGECRAGALDPLVAYRQRQRWVQSYKPVQLAAPAADKTPFRTQGVYLLTGGLGAVGLLLARFLAEQVQARLVLVARTVLPERALWEEWIASHEGDDPIRQKLEQLQACEASGAEVLIIAADVADSVQMQAALAQARQRFGVVHGVMHAAGLTTDDGFQLIQDLERATCEAQFCPKVAGLWALDQALGESPLDFCLLFSSISTVLGGLGFSGYAAANTFMNAYTSLHNQESNKTPWLCVNWDTWQKAEQVEQQRTSTVSEFVMRPNEGIDAVPRVLMAPELSHLINSTGDLHARIQQWVRLEPLSNQAPLKTQEGEGQEGAPRPQLSTAYVGASDDIEQTIIDIWVQVLGMSQIGIHDNFFELGGHSLIGMQVASRLRHHFQISLPLATLFESPTVAELADAIKLKVLEEIEKMEEDEALRLV